MASVGEREISIPPIGLGGAVGLPARARGLVIFAHGSGSSRFSVRKLAVARSLNTAGFATLLFDLLTEAEAADRRNVFDIRLLAERLIQAIDWAGADPDLAQLPRGLFGASTGAAAALVAAARVGPSIQAVVSRGGRPDLAGEALPLVEAATLLIVGGADHGVIELNERAFAELTCEKALEIIPGATHLFPEPGAMEAVMDLATAWFARWLRAD